MKKSLFYLLTFTWGLPMTLIGGIAALILIIIGHIPNGKYGYCWVFDAGPKDGGVSLGPVIITKVNKRYDHLMKHEHGHAIQNCWFGPLFPFLVGIPSMIRYWWFEYMVNVGKTDLPDYDSAWFEGQATRVGSAFIENYFGG